MSLSMQIPEVFEPLFSNSRYKAYYGGRGSAKSWSFAQALGIKGYQAKERILCVREYQNSIADSVHKLVADRIYEAGLGAWYDITQQTIRGHNGTEFIFKGIKQSPQEIKSMEGVTKCWYEEAQKASKESLKLLIPTIRTPGSELWFSWNPEEEEDPINKLFLDPVAAPDRAIIRKVGWQDNPWFPEELNYERQHLERTDPIAYEHVWEGGFIKIGDAVIFKNRVFVDDYVTKDEKVRYFFGADWGFSNDPTVLIRCYIEGDCLFIDNEAFGYGVEIDETPALFDTVPEARKWPIKADCSRPETISYMRRKGFNIEGAEKWKGSVEDGIAHLKGFSKIVIHPRCKRMIQESRLYSYKVDKVTGDVLPIIVDKHNHGWDATRYALDGYIKTRGGLGIWEKLV